MGFVVAVLEATGVEDEAEAASAPVEVGVVKTAVAVVVGTGMNGLSRPRFVVETFTAPSERSWAKTGCLETSSEGSKETDFFGEGTGGTGTGERKMPTRR